MKCFRNYTPVIIFAFSKREVEANAMNLKKVKLLTDEEESHIEAIFSNAMDTLGEDRKLPQSRVMHLLLNIELFIILTYQLLVCYHCLKEA